MQDRIGHYSRNIRLDVSKFKEHDPDDGKRAQKWKNGKKKPRNVDKKIKNYKKKISKTTDPEKIQVHMVGESHIDIAWRWRLAQTHRKAYVTFKKAVYHSKKFPDTYNFALSEPLLLDWIKEEEPELFKEIQDCVKAGNIELVGGSYVEPDCMMPSGESFVRERLYGMRFYKNHFNYLPNVEWFLDSFGYNYGLPQILSKSGAKYFWTTKITWNIQTTFPFVNFWWEGPDGTRLLTSNFGMGTHPLVSWEKFQSGRRLLRENGKKVWNYTDDYSELINHVSEEFCPHVGCFFGKGDGGHGPTYKETVVANERDKSNLFKWSRVEDFYKEIEKYSDRFPVWNDELYLENHRGCFSNWAEVKRHNRKYENAIISYETLALMTSLSNPSYKYPMDRFDKLWKTTLVNQFHDILPGSSNIEVYDDCWEDWLMQDEILDKICADIGNSLGKDNSSDNNSNNNKNTNTNVKEIFLYNTVPWERKSRIFIPTTIFDKIPKLDKNGKPNYAKIQLLSDKINESNESNEYICQPISAESENTIDQMPAGWWTVVDLEGLSNNPAKITILDDIKSLELEKNSSFEISKDSISNDDISVKIDPTTGAMLELINNSVNDGKNLLKGNTSNLTFGFLDRSLIYPAWNLKRKYWKYPRKFSNNNPDIEISDNGPIFATIVINRITRKSPITQKITLFKDRSEVFLDYLADWKKKDFMLKVNYDTATEAEISTADMVYCAIERKTQPETPNDQARYEKFCHKYFDLSTPDKKWGIAMLNEGKYAFDTMGEKGNMRLTMLRSCRETFPEYHSWLKKERKYNKEEFGHKHSKYSGLGPFKCRYALLPHNGGALLNTDGSPNPIVKRRGDEFNMPVLVIPTNDIKVDGELNKGQSFLEILTPNVFLGTLKLNEWDKTGSIIARFVEGSGIPAQAEIKINPQITEKIIEIKAVDLLEREIENKFKWNKDTGILSFDMGKFEICTFELIM